MKNLKKTLTRISIGVGVLIVFLVTISLVASRMIDTPAMRSRIQQEIYQKAGVAVDFQNLSISLFPAPNLVVNQARVSMPEMFDGTFESLQIFPAILPLFKGKIGLDKIEIESPDFTLPFPALAPSPENKEEPISISDIEDQVKSILNLLARNVPNIEVNDGSLKFLQEEKPLLFVSGLQVDIDYFLGKFKLQLSCDSNLTDTVSLQGSIATENLQSKGHLQIQQIKAHELIGYVLPQEEYGLEEALVDVDLQFTADGLKNLQAELQSAVPSIVLYRGDNKAVAREMQLQGTLKATENEFTASVTGLSLGSPRLQLAGQVTMDRKAPQVTIDVNGKDLALMPFWEATLPLWDDFPLVVLIGGIVKGGSIDNVTIKAEGNSFSEAFAVENIHLTGRFSDGKLFLPDIDIEIDSVHGEVEQSGTLLQVQNFGAHWGNTTVADISAQYVYQKDPILKVKSGKANLDLEAIYAKVSTIEKIADNLEELESVKGNIAVSAFSIEGPLLQPAQWHFAATGELKDVAIDTPRVPGSITLSSSTIAVDPEKLSLTDLRSTFQDSSINLTGFFNNYLQGFPEIDLTLDGSLGQDSIQWLADLGNMPSQFTIRGPLTLTKVHIEMDPSDNILLQGKIAEHGGPVIEVDALKQGEDLTINKLLIQDENSHATISLLDHNNKVFELNFSGKLHQTTLNKIFLFEQLSPDGELQGDIKVRYLRDQPIQSTAHGTLNGSKLIIPAQWPEPLKLEDFSVTADKNNVELNSFILHVSDRTVTGGGDISFSEKGLLVDMDFSANGIDWAVFEKNFLAAEKAEQEEKADIKEGAEKEETTPEETWDMPIQGIIRLQSEYFTYEQLTWKPLQVELLLDNNDITLTVVEAVLCAVSTPGSVAYTEQDVSLDFKLLAKAQEMDSTIPCLTDGEYLSTGTFDLTAEFAAQGNIEELADALQGRVEFSATEGKIIQAKVTEKIVDFVDNTDEYKEKMPDVATEGLFYDSIRIKGELQNNTFTFTEAILEGPTMNIVGQGSIDIAQEKVNLEVLVSPLKTVDSIVSAIPIIGDITGGSLIAVPVKVRGDLANPEVVPLAPAAVGGRIFDIMKNTLQAPVKLITPK